MLQHGLPCTPTREVGHTRRSSRRFVKSKRRVLFPFNKLCCVHRFVSMIIILSTLFLHALYIHNKKSHFQTSNQFPCKLPEDPYCWTIIIIIIHVMLLRCVIFRKKKLKHSANERSRWGGSEYALMQKVQTTQKALFETGTEWYQKTGGLGWQGVEFFFFEFFSFSFLDFAEKWVPSVPPWVHRIETVG
jgi:hypothetical protein